MSQNPEPLELGFNDTADLAIFCEEYTVITHSPWWFFKTAIYKIYVSTVGHAGDLLGLDWWP